MSAKLFVGGLAWATDDQSLHDSFKQFGTIASAMVVTDRSTGRSKGFGFVTFADPTQAQKAVDGMQGKDLDGRTIRVDFANDQNSSGPSRRRDSSERPRDAPYSRREYGGREGGRDGVRDRDGNRDGGRREYGGSSRREGGRREGGSRGGDRGYRRND